MSLNRKMIIIMLIIIPVAIVSSSIILSTMITNPSPHNPSKPNNILLNTPLGMTDTVSTTTSANSIIIQPPKPTQDCNVTSSGSASELAEPCILTINCPAGRSLKNDYCYPQSSLSTPNVKFTSVAPDGDKRTTILLSADYEIMADALKLLQIVSTENTSEPPTDTFSGFIAYINSHNPNSKSRIGIAFSICTSSSLTKGVCEPQRPSCPQGLIYKNGMCTYPPPSCEQGYIVQQYTAGSYACQPDPKNPPAFPIGEYKNFTLGQTLGGFTIKKINSYNVTGIWNSPYPIYNPNGSTLRILHLGDDVGFGCDGTSDILTSINSNTVTFLVNNKPKSPYGCPICLSGNTFIDTPNGKISVKELKVGMPVSTVDEFGNKKSAIVLKTGKTQVSSGHQMVHIILADGRELFASPGHPTTDGREFGGLKPLETLDDSVIIIAEFVPYDESYTYDILPSGYTGFYWANGILVGSTLK